MRICNSKALGFLITDLESNLEREWRDASSAADAWNCCSSSFGRGIGQYLLENGGKVLGSVGVRGYSVVVYRGLFDLDIENPLFPRDFLLERIPNSVTTIE